MTDTPHNDVKEAIQDGISRTAVYRMRPGNRSPHSMTLFGTR